jgi:Zinc-binding dehydrogenase
VLKRLGADHVVNYREDANWGMTARRLTPNEAGFDHIIEVGGTDTMAHSQNAIKFEGIISIIGVMTGITWPTTILDAIDKICTLRCIHVGSRVQMEDMMAGIEANGIQPVLDKRIFALEELREALEYLVRSLLFFSHVFRLVESTEPNAFCRSLSSMSVKLSSRLHDLVIMSLNHSISSVLFQSVEVSVSVGRLISDTANFESRVCLSLHGADESNCGGEVVLKRIQHQKIWTLTEYQLAQLSFNMTAL